MQKKDSARYQLHLSVKETPIPMKPYIVNTFGDVICGLLRSLSGVEDMIDPQTIFLEMDPVADEEHRVLFEWAGNEIVIKSYVQNMIRSTIDGFLSTLKGVPKNMKELPVVIELSPL